MMTRYRVIRKTVRFCKQTYRKGDFLPESFSERDLYRVLYPSRIEKVEVRKQRTTTTEEKPSTSPAVSKQGTEQAKKPSAAPVKNTGASLSGQTILKK